MSGKKIPFDLEEQYDSKTPQDLGDHYNMKTLPYSGATHRAASPDPTLAGSSRSPPAYSECPEPYIPNHGPQIPVQDTPKIIYVEQKKRSCMDKMCCGCFSCCPKWMRWCTCTILILIIIAAIIIGIIIGVFKVPSIEFNGYKNTPVVTFNNKVLNVAVDFDIRVDNPNFETITFDKVSVDAYYPSPYYALVGSGSMNNVYINSEANTNYTFPFTMSIDANNATQKSVLSDLITKCGYNGTTKQNIDLNFYLYPTIRIVSFTITPTITKLLSIPCPLEVKRKRKRKCSCTHVQTIE
ncbi:unnamed protein product [Rhizopus stolonifer]